MVSTVNAILKFLMLALPFLKESLFGDDSVTEVFRRNKVATILFVANVTLTFSLTWITLEAWDYKTKLAEERAEASQLQQKIKTMLPIGVKNEETIVQIGMRFKKLEDEKKFIAKRLTEAYRRIEELLDENEKLRLVCRPTDTPPPAPSNPPPPPAAPPAQEEEEVQRDREKANRLKQLLNQLD